MKKIDVDGICCEGCAEEIKHIFENIYGVTKVSVSIEDSSITFGGYVSQRIIEEALLGTQYKVKEIKKI